jgi:hypothetical protein
MKVDKAKWPVIARADWYNGEHEFQANTIRRIVVREHNDGRRIVYGYQCAGNGGQHAGTYNPRGGFVVDPLPGASPNEVETVRAIRRVAGVIEDDNLGDMCIADLPAEEDEPTEPETAPAPAAVDNQQLGTLLALLVRAYPHVPEEMQLEIRAAMGWTTPEAQS